MRTATKHALFFGTRGALVVLFSCILLFAGGPVFAATAGGAIIFDISPDAPGSNTPVSIRMKSYAMDLGLAHIIWYVNGSVVQDAVAETSFNFTTGDPGEDTTVDAVVIMPDGRKFRETLVFAPVDVDLLWEADTYVPPFYKGKALPTHESPIRAVAFPFPGATSSPDLFNFKWSLGSAQGLGGGLGRNTASTLGAWPRSKVTLGVSTERPDGSIGGKKTIQIRSVDPKVLFYEKHPLAGVRYGVALKRAETIAGEYSLRAAPFFFANNDRKNDKLIFTWKANGRRIPDPREDLRILRDEGSLHMTLSVQNSNRVLQSAEGSVFVDFR